jgi:probable F420-dependent oxidoreductase
MEKAHPVNSERQPGAPRPFRFGVVAAAARSADEWANKARQIESLGYSTLVMPENLRYTLAALPASGVALAATRSLRVGTYVLINDFRNPVLLAKDVATLDLLSDGRFELGIGAGRPGFEAELRMLGLSADSGAVRVARLAESLAIVTALLEGKRVTTSGPHYVVAEAEVSPRPVQQPRPPLLVAGSGRQLLRLAGRSADIVALGLPPDASETTVAERIGWIREGAGERFTEIEININLMAVGNQVPRWVSAQMGLDAAELARRGSVSAVTGTPDQMCEQLLERRKALGISYVVVSDEFMEAFAPVVQRLTGQ